jgi:hypothetical protein
MSYIRIRKTSLAVDVVTGRSTRGVFVPIKRDRSGSAFNDQLHYLVYFNVLYPSVQARDQEKGRRVKYKLIEPDPWLIALAAIMWQGLIQGLTWDVIKASCLAAFSKLRKKNLAPPKPTQRVDTRKKRLAADSRTQIGFSWTHYGHAGRPLREFFLGVKREFRKRSREERRQITSGRKKTLRR